MCSWIFLACLHRVANGVNSVFVFLSMAFFAIGLSVFLGYSHLFRLTHLLLRAGYACAFINFLAADRRVYFCTRFLLYARRAFQDANVVIFDSTRQHRALNVFHQARHEQPCHLRCCFCSVQPPVCHVVPGNDHSVLVL